MQLNFILVFSLILLRQSYDTKLKLVLHYVDPVGFELTLLLPHPPQCWDYI